MKSITCDRCGTVQTNHVRIEDKEKIRNVELRSGEGDLDSTRGEVWKDFCPACLGWIKGQMHNKVEMI